MQRAGGLAGVTAVAAGDSHSLALRSDGTVVAWGCGTGASDFGQCSVPSGLSGVTAIAAGASHSLALKGDGTVVAWGCLGGDYGQCSVPGGLSGVTAIAAGGLPQPGPEKRRHCRRLGLRRLRLGQCSVPSGLTGVTAIAAGDCAQPGVGRAREPDDHLRPAREQDLRRPGLPRRRDGIFRAAGLLRGQRELHDQRCDVHLTGAGSCTMTASQPGDANYNPAPDVSQTFSIAPATCRVPKVVGKRLPSAKRTIARRHCRTGKVRHAYSRKRKKGIVISQSRRPGRVLPAGSKISLIVSRGRTR